jgi:hypothetical protein
MSGRISSRRISPNLERSSEVGGNMRVGGRVAVTLILNRCNLVMTLRNNTSLFVTRHSGI